MKKFREFLKEELKNKEFEKSYYEGLEKARIAIEITLFREKKGLTQAKLAELTGTSQSAIARLEDIDYKGYSLSTLRKIADALDLELVVSLREKGAEIYEKEPTIVYHVTWGQKKKRDFKFSDSPGVSSEQDVELVA